MAVWKKTVSRRWLFVLALLAAIPAAFAGVSAWYPPPDELLAQMWPLRTQVLAGIRSDDPQQALPAVREWQRLVKKLPRAVSLHAGRPDREVEQRIAVLEQELDRLDATLVKGETAAVQSQAVSCFEAHRRCAEAFQASPPVPAAKGGMPTCHHQHGVQELAADQPVPTLTMSIHEDPKVGWNLLVETANFTFTPQNASREHVPGEGHAHLFIDGEKITRLYGGWYYIGPLPPGEHTVLVTLNTNDHNDYTHQGKVIMAEEKITVPDNRELVYFGTKADSPRGEK